jgi:hypothetical protein
LACSAISIWLAGAGGGMRFVHRVECAWTQAPHGTMVGGDAPNHLSSVSSRPQRVAEANESKWD